MIRAFVAIPLPEALCHRLAGLTKQLQRELPTVRWSRSETLHLTLRFFGDIAEESLEKIAEIMLSIGRLHPPFVAELTGLGAFTAADRAQVFWLGVRDPGALAVLYAALEQRLPEAGIPREQRPYTPHLTLGRQRGRGLAAGPVLARFRAVECGPLPVSRLILYESRLQPGGALHIPRYSVPLGGAAGGTSTNPQSADN